MSVEPPSNLKRKSPDYFPDTSWTLIVQAQRTGSDSAILGKGVALAELCEIYWNPIFMAFRLIHHLPEEEAKDVTQDFIAWYLEADKIKDANPSKGLFRHYLLHLMKFFLKNYNRKKRSRGKGSAIHIPIHPDPKTSRSGMAIPQGLTPTQIIERKWIYSTVEQAQEKLKEYELRKGRKKDWRVMREFLTMPASYTYEEAAKTLSITQSTLNGRIKRLRKRYYRYFYELVSATVSTEDEFKQEIELIGMVFRPNRSSFLDSKE